MNRVLTLKTLTPFIFALGIFAGTNAEAKIATVQVTAEAAEVAGDRAATEAAVKREARRKAVEEGAGTLVESNTIVRNYQLISDEIATTAKGVLSSEEWGDMKVANGVAKITLTAKVSPVAIENAICTVIKANHDPKVAFVFVEKTGNESTAWNLGGAERGMIEALLTEAFLKNCFTIVESGVKVTEVAANGDIPQATIKEAIQNSNAQYILTGTGKTLQAENFLGSSSKSKKIRMKSYGLSASLRMINAETNEVVLASAHSTNMLGISAAQALAKNPAQGARLTDKIMSDVIGKIGQRWADDLVNAGKVVVRVEGVKNYAASKSFRAGVEKVFKGSKVTSRSLRSGVAIFDVNVEGGSDALASGIDGKKFGKSTVEVLEVTQGKVILQLK